MKTEKLCCLGEQQGNDIYIWNDLKVYKLMLLASISINIVYLKNYIGIHLSCSFHKVFWISMWSGSKILNSDQLWSVCFISPHCYCRCGYSLMILPKNALLGIGTPPCAALIPQLDSRRKLVSVKVSLENKIKRGVAGHVIPAIKFLFQQY